MEVDPDMDAITLHPFLLMMLNLESIQSGAVSDVTEEILEGLP
jgi:hypothetical protein